MEATSRRSLLAVFAAGTLLMAASRMSMQPAQAAIPTRALTMDPLRQLIEAARADITALMAGRPVTPGVFRLSALPFGAV